MQTRVPSDWWCEVPAGEPRVDALVRVSAEALRRVEQHEDEIRAAAPHHLDWPGLDVDLHFDSIETPDAFLLVSGAQQDGAFS